MKTLNKKISKKISTMLLALLALNLAPNAITASADTEALAAGANLSYTVTGDLKAGNTVEIALNAKDATDIYGASWDFAYDPTLLEIKSMTPGSIFPSNVNVPVNKFSNGQAELAITLTGDAKAASTSGTVAVMKVKLLKDGKVNLKTSTSNDALSATGTNCRVKLAKTGEKVASIPYTAVDKEIVIGGDINPEPPIVETSKVTSFTCDTPSGQPVGTTFNFTAKASPDGQSKYSFYVKEDGVWVKKLAGSLTRNTFSWTPTKPGQYIVKVRVQHLNSPNSSDDYKDINIKVNEAGNSSGVTSFKADKSPTQKLGTTINFTAQASPADKSLYSYYVLENNEWVKKTSSSTKNTYAWKPSAKGDYIVRVRVKHVDSAQSFDGHSDLNFTIN